SVQGPTKATPQLAMNPADLNEITDDVSLSIVDAIISSVGRNHKWNFNPGEVQRKAKWVLPIVNANHQKELTIADVV
ncbi:hypothetical protein PENTCL1PPCAC_19230, partial [Pristionchus entomophagus]